MTEPKKLGRPKGPDKVLRQVRITPETAQRLQELCEKQQRNMSNVVAVLIDKAHREQEET